MAKSEKDNAAYRITEIVGTSPISWEEAVKSAVHVATRTLRDLRIAEVVKLDVKIEDGAVTLFRARIALSFKYDA